MRTLHTELVGDRVLSVHVLHGARVLAGIVTCNLTDEQRSFRQQADALGDSVRCALDLPVDLRQRCANSLARQFHIFAVVDRERVVERSNFGRNWNTQAKFQVWNTQKPQRIIRRIPRLPGAMVTVLDCSPSPTLVDAVTQKL